MRMHRSASACKLALHLLISGLLVFLMGAGTALAEDCKPEIISIRGEYEALQSDGGLWRFMEQSTHLRSDSMIGFQIDGKIQRAVMHLDSLCKSGKSLPGDLVGSVKGLLETARGINNKSSSRTPAKKLLAMLNELNDSVTQLLEKNGI